MSMPRRPARPVSWVYSAGRHVDVGLAVELDEPLEHHGARGHVDPEGQRLGGEDRADAPRGEELLDHLAERRQHAGVVRRIPAGEAVDEVPVAEDAEVLVGDARHPLLDDAPDALALLVGDHPHVLGQQLANRRLAADPAEDERDRGQQRLALEPFEDLGAGGAATGTAAARPGGPGHPPATGTTAGTAAATTAARGEPVGVVRATRQVGDGLEQLRVHPGRRGVAQRVDATVRGVGRVERLVDEEVVHPLPDHHVLPQRNRPVLGDHHRHVTPDLGEPRAELLRVRHRGRQRDQPDVRREVDDHLLPHRAAEPVGEVVDLVHDDVAEPHEGRRGRIHHVAEHLGGHDDDRRLAVDRGVTGEQADVAGAVAADEVGVLLVGEGLDRRRVERLSPGRHREVDGELADHRLAGAGRGGDEDAVAGLQRLARLDLERVQREAQRRRERRELTLPSSRHDAHAMSRRRAPRGRPRGRAAAARTARRPPG